MKQKIYKILIFFQINELLLSKEHDRTQINMQSIMFS